MKHDLAEVVLTCRALSAQYGVDVFPTGKEAYTTVDSRGRYVIGVPFIPDMGDGEWAMLRGYIDHECGHVKYTDMAGSDARLDGVLRKYFETSTVRVRPEEHPFMEQQLKPWVHTVWNIFEDIRVEHLMGLDFPGCKYNFKKLAVEVFNESNALDSLAGIYNSHLAALLRDAVTLYLLYSVRSVMVPELLPAKDALCKELCGGVRYRGTHIDMAAYGRDIDALARIYAVDPRDSLGATYQFMLLVRDLLSAYGDDNDSASIRTYTNSLGALDTRAAGKSKSEQDTTIKVARGNNAAGVGRSTDVSSMTKSEMSSRALRSADDGKRVSRGLSSALQELQSFQAYDSMDEFQAGSREDGLSAFAQKERRAVELQPDMVSSVDSIAASAGGRLAAVLQSETYQRCRSGWSGRLDGRRLHKTGVGDGRVFSRRAERKALHTEVIILYDASGSMQYTTVETSWDNAGYAAVASYGLLKALRNIPHVRSAVWAFQNTACVPMAKFDMPVPGKYLHPHGSTPLGASVFRLLGEYTSQPDWRRILLIMSDGAPDSKELFRSALTAAGRSGVETYGIGIRTDAMNLFFPEEHRLELYDLRKLVPGMFTMMQRAMLKGVHHA